MSYIVIYNRVFVLGIPAYDKESAIHFDFLIYVFLSYFFVKFIFVCIRKICLIFSM